MLRDKTMQQCDMTMSVQGNNGAEQHKMRWDITMQQYDMTMSMQGDNTKCDGTTQ